MIATITPERAGAALRVLGHLKAFRSAPKVFAPCVTGRGAPWRPGCVCAGCWAALEWIDGRPLVGPTRQEALQRIAALAEASPVPKPRGAQGEPAPQALSDRLRAIFEAEGETVIVRRLGIDRGALAQEPRL